MGRWTTLDVSGCGRYDRSEAQPATSGPTARASPIRQTRPANEAVRDIVVSSSIVSVRYLETSICIGRTMLLDRGFLSLEDDCGQRERKVLSCQWVANMSLLTCWAGVGRGWCRETQGENPQVFPGPAKPEIPTYSIQARE